MATAARITRLGTTTERCSGCGYARRRTDCKDPLHELWDRLNDAHSLLVLARDELEHPGEYAEQHNLVQEMRDLADTAQEAADELGAFMAYRVLSPFGRFSGGPPTRSSQGPSEN